MIRTIQSIRDFGIFSGFRWPVDLPEFKRFNLIYGWNYSGKTTLSRALRCFELGQHHDDFLNAQVQLKNDEGAIHDLTDPATAPHLRVFNTDFVRENLAFETGTASPILVLGAEDIARQKDLDAKRAELQQLRKQRAEAESQLSETRSALSKALTNYARDLIKIQLSVPDYDKTRFKPVVVSCSADYRNHLLDEDRAKENIAVFRSADKRPSLSTKKLVMTPMEDLIETSSSLLSRVVTGGKPLQRLREDPAVEKWVNEGRSLHWSKDKCQFCGNPLPDNLMDQLSSHFSADYEDLLKHLSTQENALHSAMNEGIQLDDKAAFYPELSSAFEARERELNNHFQTRRSSLEALIQALDAKRTKVFTPLSCPSLADPTDQITTAVQEINAIVVKHNARTTAFEEKRKEAFAKLEKHYAARFVLQEKYNDRVQSLDALETSIQSMSERLTELEAESAALEQQLSEASKGAARINALLAACFGNDDLRIEVTADERFRIMRGDSTAKNLSEGEQTAIAFAYFITRVQDGTHSLDDTTVVVDDPVCSLDSNHTFNTYALVKTLLAESHQLFILTHSFSFYNLIREWALEEEKKKTKPMREWRNWGIFYCQRRAEGSAVLEEIPRELLVFKSEYHYLFSKLYRFNASETDDFDYLLGLPNIVRRFLEAFGGIMIPLSMGLRGKMARLFPDHVERERVWKYINYFSHNTTITRSLTIPDMSESRAAVESVLRAVKDWNADYFKDLESEVAREQPTGVLDGNGRA